MDTYKIFGRIGTFKVIDSPKVQEPQMEYKGKDSRDCLGGSLTNMGFRNLYVLEGGK